MFIGIKSSNCTCICNGSYKDDIPVYNQGHKSHKIQHNVLFTLTFIKKNRAFHWLPSIWFLILSLHVIKCKPFLIPRALTPPVFAEIVIFHLRTILFNYLPCQLGDAIILHFCLPSPAVQVLLTNVGALSLKSSPCNDCIITVWF